MRVRGRRRKIFINHFAVTVRKVSMLKRCSSNLSTFVFANRVAVQLFRKHYEASSQIGHIEVRSMHSGVQWVDGVLPFTTVGIHYWWFLPNRFHTSPHFDS